MKISKRVLATLVALTTFMASTILIFIASPQSFAATPALTMGTSSTYGVLASTGVTSSNPSNISGSSGGDVGVGGATAPAGTITLSGSQILGGASLTALNDANTAFADTRISVALPVELGSTSLTSGAYSGGTFGMNGTLTLDGLGDTTSVFIFNTTTTLITASSSQVVLINGAQACNVFWQIGSSATLGASSIMVGHIIAAVSIDTGTTTTIDGQLIALTGAVTLGGSSVVNDGCAIPSHTVTFDGNTSNGGSTAAQTTNIATALTSNGFTKSGYTFSGWNTVAGGGGVSYANGGTYSFTSDLTLFAQWTLIPPVSHTVTFFGNGFDAGTTAPQTSNASTALTLNGFTHTGYTFAGWNTVPTGVAGTAFGDGASYNFAADLTLYAQWIVIPPALHTVTFLGNGFDAGATAPETNSVAALLTSNGFTRTSYTFTNWNTAINGGGTTYLNGAPYSFAADLTLFAQWTLIPPIVHTVTFAGNGFDGGATPPESNTAPTPLTSNGFARTSDSFTNWNTAVDGSGLTYINGASYSFVSDLTLYAQWVVIVFPPVIHTLPPPAPVVIATPKPIPADGVLQISQVVINRFVGKELPSDFAVSIRKEGSNTQLQYVQGTMVQPFSIKLAPGIYDISETATLGYRGVWSGPITAGGAVVVISDQVVSVTRTHLDSGQFLQQIPNPIPTIPVPIVTQEPTQDPPPTITPVHTVDGGALPVTGSQWERLFFLGLVLMFFSGLTYVLVKMSTREWHHYILLNKNF